MRQDLLGRFLRFCHGQRAVIGPQGQAEGDALFARGDSGAAVDVEEADIPQQLAAGSGDAVLQLADGAALVADQGQVPGDGRVFGQPREIGSPVFSQTTVFSFLS